MAKKAKKKSKAQSKKKPKVKKSQKGLKIVIAIVILFLAFVGLRAINGTMPAKYSADIKASQEVVKQDPYLGNYQLAVDHLRAGKIFKTYGYLNKVNKAAKKNYITQKTLVNRGYYFYVNQPESVANYYYLAFIQIALEQPGAALRSVNRILTIDSKDDFAYALRGFLYAQYYKNSADAISEVKQAIALNPKPAIYQYLLSEGYKMAKDEKSSGAALKSALWKLLLGY